MDRRTCQLLVIRRSNFLIRRVLRPILLTSDNRTGLVDRSAGDRLGKSIDLGSGSCNLRKQFPQLPPVRRPARKQVAKPAFYSMNCYLLSCQGVASTRLPCGTMCQAVVSTRSFARAANTACPQKSQTDVTSRAPFASFSIGEPYAAGGKVLPAASLVGGKLRRAARAYFWIWGNRLDASLIWPTFLEFVAQSTTPRLVSLHRESSILFSLIDHPRRTST